MRVLSKAISREKESNQKLSKGEIFEYHCKVSGVSLQVSA
jgi:hypothetical protein